MKASYSKTPLGILSNSLFLKITGMLLLLHLGTGIAQDFDPELGQSIFSSPDLASRALVQAIADHDKEAMNKILGEDHKQILSIDEVDPADRDNFLAAWSRSHTLIEESENRQVLAIGENNWTLPIPLVRQGSGWYFDVDAGAERMRIRRIGRNELAAMQAVLAYYDAQIEYAEQDRNSDGRLEYAQKLISTQGKQDGLYWEAAAGESQSPLGHLFAETTPGNAYYGYHYRILTSQGEHAQGGAYPYILGGRMIGGFALVAWPAEYGDSGVMSFLVSHDGLVYEQDLGPDGAATASAMNVFDPTPDWQPAKEVDGQ